MFMRLPTDLKKHASGGLASVLLTLVAAVAAATDSPAQNWWEPNSGKTLAASIAYANGSGALAILNTAGAMPTEGHAFFSSLGGNGRACVTCHQPADGMSVSIDTIQARWRTTAGADPLFAAIDGSNCPTLPQKDPASHSLLLNHGLFRIFRAWPPRDPDGGIVTPQFSIEVVRDPTGCNLDPVYGLKSAQPRISV